MDGSKHLILLKGKDKTADVKWCKYNPNVQKYEVVFSNERHYFYNYIFVEWIKEPDVLNPALVRISHGGKELFKMRDIRVFRGRSMEYWRVEFSNGSARLYSRDELSIEMSCLDEAEAESCMSYLKQVAAMNELKNEVGEVLLKKEYEKLDYVGKETAMALYLNPGGHNHKKHQSGEFIFPFGGNASQFKAVEAALNNQISVIQGPPGTGKTQTILNIIANLLVADKTVQIVSNSDVATGNVLEKLDSDQYKLGFLVAALGKEDNITEFIAAQTKCYPDLKAWEMETEDQEELSEQIKNLVTEVSQTFSNQERLAEVRKELDSLILEIQYFEQYCMERGLDCSAKPPRRSLKSETLMTLWQECYDFSEQERSVSFWFKIKSA
ncbi:MAG: AAA domain-containing protein, partial [Eubacterium sp.]